MCRTEKTQEHAFAPQTTPLSAAEVAEGYAAFDSQDFRRGYRAFLDKAEPEFEGD